MVKGTCETCICFSPENNGQYGYCHRHPPIVFTFGAEVRTEFPRIYKQQYCFDFIPANMQTRR